jgi:hypothetical protein
MDVTIDNLIRSRYVNFAGFENFVPDLLSRYVND